MDNISIDVNLYERQHSSWIRESVEDFGFDLVYCPMCEVNHENNTNCQRND